MSRACAQWRARLTSHPTDNLVICHGCGHLGRTLYRDLSGACHGNRVLLHQPPPVAPALLHKLLSNQPVRRIQPWLLAAEGVSDRRWLSRVTRKHSARPSVNSNPTKGHMRTADVGKATGPCGLDPRILCNTFAVLWKAGCKSLDGYLSAGRHEVVLFHGSLPEAFGVHFRRVKRAAARERCPCAGSVSPAVLVLRQAQQLRGSMVPTGPSHPRQLLIGETEVSNATLQCVSFSGAAAHVVLPTNKSGNTDHSKTRSLERARDSSLQRSAQSTCSKRSTSGPQISPRRMENHSSMHRYSLLRRITLRPRCKSAVRCGRQPAFRATGARTCVSQIFKQCRSNNLQLKQSQHSCRLHTRFLSIKIFTSTHWMNDFRPRPGFGGHRPIAKIGPSPAQLPSCRNRPGKPS